MNIKRYNLQIAQEKWDEICLVAEREGLPVAAILRRYVDLGLIASSPDARMFVSRGGGPQRRLRMFSKDDDDDTLSLD
jgi:hypothetical protein